jgi:hypothetical protein
MYNCMYGVPSRMRCYWVPLRGLQFQCTHWRGELYLWPPPPYHLEDEVKDSEGEEQTHDDDSPELLDWFHNGDESSDDQDKWDNKHELSNIKMIHIC